MSALGLLSSHLKIMFISSRVKTMMIIKIVYYWLFKIALHTTKPLKSTLHI